MIVEQPLTLAVGADVAFPWVTPAVIEGADHFFFLGKLYPLGEAVSGWARQLTAEPAISPRGLPDARRPAC